MCPMYVSHVCVPCMCLCVSLCVDHVCLCVFMSVCEPVCVIRKIPPNEKFLSETMRFNPSAPVKMLP